MKRFVLVGLGRFGGISGFVVKSPSGEVLRRFLDTNGDNQVDQWCYFKDGIDVGRARIQDAVLASCFDPDGVPLQLSCGHTELSDDMNTHDLLESADLAMLTLKRSLAR